MVAWSTAWCLLFFVTKYFDRTLHLASEVKQHMGGEVEHYGNS